MTVCMSGCLKNDPTSEADPKDADKQVADNPITPVDSAKPKPDSLKPPADTGTTAPDTNAIKAYPWDNPDLPCRLSACTVKEYERRRNYRCHRLPARV